VQTLNFLLKVEKKEWYPLPGWFEWPGIESGSQQYIKWDISWLGCWMASFGATNYCEKLSPKESLSPTYSASWGQNKGRNAPLRVSSPVHL